MRTKHLANKALADDVGWTLRQLHEKYDTNFLTSSSIKTFLSLLLQKTVLQTQCHKAMQTTTY